MLRPVCVDCGKEMNCKLNGVIIKTDEHSVCRGDLYECPDCKQTVITGCGSPYGIEKKDHDEKIFVELQS